LKAMVLKEASRIELEELPEPEPGPDEVVIKVAYCGICMTDVHIYDGSFPVKTPIILGHECSGIVSNIGKEVKHIEVGDHVAINPLISCGYCRYCLSGKANLCENALAVGGAGKTIINGAYAEYVKVPEKNVIKFDKNVPLKYAALTEPLACAIHGIELAEVNPGDRVAIIGAGPMGLILTYLAVYRGASQVIVLDLKDERLETAKLMGASDIINPRKCNPEEVIKDVTDDELVDVVIEAVGAPETVQDTFKYVRRGGTILIFGVPPKDTLVNFSPFSVYFNELRIVGSYALTPNSFLKSAELISKSRINFDYIITEIYPLEKLNEAIEKAKRGEGLKKLIKVH